MDRDQEQSRQCPGQDQHAEGRDRDQVGQRRQPLDLPKQGDGERHHGQGKQPLGPQRPFEHGEPGNFASRIGPSDQPQEEDGTEGQPETRTTHCERIQQQHRQQRRGKGADRRWPTTGQGAGMQNGEHQHCPLRGQRETRQGGIPGSGKEAGQSRRARRRVSLAQPRAQTPETSHEQKEETGDQAHVQSGDGKEVGGTRDPERLGLRGIDTVPNPQGDGAQHAGTRQGREQRDAFGQPAATPVDGSGEVRLEPRRRPAFHVARRADAGPEQPGAVVEAVRIAHPGRRLQSHGERPEFPWSRHLRWLPPAQPHTSGQTGHTSFAIDTMPISWPTDQGDVGGRPSRKVFHPASDAEILPDQIRRKPVQTMRMGCPAGPAQARQAPGQPAPVTAGEDRRDGEQGQHRQRDRSERWPVEKVEQQRTCRKGRSSHFPAVCCGPSVAPGRAYRPVSGFQTPDRYCGYNRECPIG